MIYEVDGWNNFCRVFELPLEYPNGFCFGGGHLVAFRLIDWFYPVPEIHLAAINKKEWIEKYGKFEVKEVTCVWLKEKLVPFLQEKIYVKPGRQYLVLCDFGAAITFKAKE